MSWNLRKGHGKAICFLRIKGEKDIKLKKIRDQSETGFNFSINRHKHAFYPL